MLGALAAVPAMPALAQFRVEVSGVGLTQIPIALPAFRGEEGVSQKISEIVRADLERSGLFRNIPATGQALDETSRPDMAEWRQRGADALATGSVTRLTDGRYDVRFRLWDVVKAQDLGGQGFVVVQGDLRLVAHRIADFIYEKLTGEKASSPPALPTSPRRASAMCCGWPMQMARMPSLRCRALSPLFLRPGRPTGQSWPMCL